MPLKSHNFWIAIVAALMLPLLYGFLQIDLHETTLVIILVSLAIAPGSYFMKGIKERLEKLKKADSDDPLNKTTQTRMVMELMYDLFHIEWQAMAIAGLLAFGLYFQVKYSQLLIMVALFLVGFLFTYLYSNYSIKHQIADLKKKEKENADGSLQESESQR